VDLLWLQERPRGVPERELSPAGWGYVEKASNVLTMTLSVGITC